MNRKGSLHARARVPGQPNCLIVDGGRRDRARRGHDPVGRRYAYRAAGEDGRLFTLAHARRVSARGAIEKVPDPVKPRGGGRGELTGEDLC